MFSLFTNPDGPKFPKMLLVIKDLGFQTPNCPKLSAQLLVSTVQ